MNRVLFDARMAYIKLIRNWFYSGLSMMTISLTLLLPIGLLFVCLLYTSDAADDLLTV